MEKANRPNLTVIKNNAVPEDMGTKALPQMKPIKEMMALTGLSYTYLRQLCLEGKIVHIRAGKKYLINYDRFIDFLNGVEVSGGNRNGDQLKDTRGTRYQARGRCSV